MKRAPTVAILHPGRMGAVVAAEAVRRGAEVQWCPDGRSVATAQRAHGAGLQPSASLEDLLAWAETVLSICPPAAAEHVAAHVADRGFTGLYVEANAISSVRAERIRGRITRAGGRFVDAAVFGPPFSEGTAARVYVAGDADDLAAIADLFAATRVDVQFLASSPCAASTLKMAHSSYQKASRALAAVALALAGTHGVAEHLQREAARIQVSPLIDDASLPGVAARAWRWGPEMAEVADALAAANLPTDLAEAAAAVLARWHEDRDLWHLSIGTVLQQLGTAR